MLDPYCRAITRVTLPDGVQVLHLCQTGPQASAILRNSIRGHTQGKWARSTGHQLQPSAPLFVWQCIGPLPRVSHVTAWDHLSTRLQSAALH